ELIPANRGCGENCYPAALATLTRLALAERAAVVEDVGRAADDAAQRVVHDQGRYARGRLDPARQAQQQRPAPGQADLAQYDILGEVRGEAQQDLPHRVDDRADARFERVRDELSRDPLG